MSVEPPSEADITAAQKLTRKYLCGGSEPPAALVHPVALLLAEHRRALTAAWRSEKTS